MPQNMPKVSRRSTDVNDLVDLEMVMIFAETVNVI